MRFTPHITKLIDTLRQRVLILDGAMGTMIQKASLQEQDFHMRGLNTGRVMKGCNDILVVSRPDVISDIHHQYIAAGADIIETCTFNANKLSLSEYGLSNHVTLINTKAVEIAREAARNASRDVWVAGSVGPTGKSLTMAINLGDDIDFDTMESAYYEQVHALIAAGVDLLLIETIFDTLNAKAAIHASLRAMDDLQQDVPIILSATLTETGRTLSGQTLEAFVVSVSHASPLAISLNCGFGPEALTPYIESLKSIPTAVGLYANAGLPNKMGEYDETPQAMAAAIEPLLRGGYLNILGGCCGTTPAHIAALKEVAESCNPRHIPQDTLTTTLAGLEPLVIEPGKNLINIGERCNVAGSRKFLRLIKESNYDEAVNIAISQVEGGAQAVDVNMDDGMLDATACMSKFVKLLQVEPEVARVPMVIDSSRWEVILAGLKCIQGKPLVNSISLKEGPEAMLARAREIHRLGAAMVVMAFDEEGQATTYERKVAICTRAYNLLTREGGIPPCDIFFDPNILTVATGIKEHDAYALDYINAVREIKRTLPGAKTGGGVSNLSFAFRGNTPLREAMHAVFLYHAIAAGLDTAIVNAAALIPVDDVEPKLREAIEDVLFMRREDAAERLAAIASEMMEQAAGQKDSPAIVTTVATDPAQRLSDMVVKGITASLPEVLDELTPRYKRVVDLIDQILMPAMNRVGELFGSGRMFLPQVVKSATVMKNAVAILQPRIESEQSQGVNSAISRPTIVMATVKGDVHDIGKNIVAIIMRCNGWNVVDLGVMVPPDKILEAINKHHADAVGLSGLITPSLEEMCHVARMLQEHGIEIPMFVGGATTSALHTAVKIAPERPAGLVVHTRDAAVLPVIATRLVSSETREACAREILDEQARLRQENQPGTTELLPLDQARSKRFKLKPAMLAPAEGNKDFEFTAGELKPLINTRALLAAWKLNPADTASPQATELLNAMHSLIERLDNEGYKIIGRAVTIAAHSDNDDNIIVGDAVLPMLRQQHEGIDGNTLSVADYVSRDGKSNITLFVTTAPRIEKETDSEYLKLLSQSVAHRLVEAATEKLHRLMSGGEKIGIRPAIGYPMIPDQSMVHLLQPLLKYEELGIEVTEHGALNPSSTVTGLIIYEPDARYFDIGEIDNSQLSDYALRRGVTTTYLKPYIGQRKR